MTLQPLVVFFHLLGATVLVAGSMYGPLLRAALRRADDVAALRGWLRHAHDAARANPPAALVVVLSGVYLSRGRWSEGWLVVSLVEFVASATLSLMVEATARRMEKLAESATKGGIGEPIERLRGSVGWGLRMDAHLANNLALLFLMVQQPGLAGSIATVVLANAAVPALRFLRRRGAPAVAVAGAGGDSLGSGA